MKIEKYLIERSGWLNKKYKILRDRKHVMNATLNFVNRKMVVSDLDGMEILRISRPFKLFKAEYHMTVNDDIRAVIKEKGKLLGTALEIDSVSGLYFIDGNWGDRHFQIANATDQIAQVSRSGILSKKYGLAIKEGEDSLFILGLTLIIDMMIQVKAARNAS